MDPEETLSRSRCKTIKLKKTRLFNYETVLLYLSCLNPITHRVMSSVSAYGYSFPAWVMPWMRVDHPRVLSGEAQFTARNPITPRAFKC